MKTCQINDFLRLLIVGIVLVSITASKVKHGDNHPKERNVSSLRSLKATKTAPTAPTTSTKVKPEVATLTAETPTKQQNKPRRLFFSDLLAPRSTDNDEPEDADADDYYSTMAIMDALMDEYNDDNTNVTISDINNSTTTSKTTPWYALSHYIPPNTILYDTIEGFFIAVTFCLIIATIYNYTYYCCFTRCGCCPDDRIYKSLLHRKGRQSKRVRIPRQRRKKMTQRNSFFSSCCFFCCYDDGDDGVDIDGHDGKGVFVPLSTDREGYDGDNSTSEDDNSSDDSSLSQDSVLSLEYGDEHLIDEYGEVSDRLEDSKLEVAAKTFFDHEEKKAAALKKGSGNASMKSQRMRRTYGGSVGSRSRMSRRSRAKSMRSQTSSILSSDSGSSLSSYGPSSDEDDDHSLEMEAAMMDLELAQQRAKNKL